MGTHVYTPADVVKLKNAVQLIRQVQERIEDDDYAYQSLDELMQNIETLIDEVESEIERGK